MKKTGTEYGNLVSAKMKLLLELQDLHKRGYQPSKHYTLDDDVEKMIAEKYALMYRRDREQLASRTVARRVRFADPEISASPIIGSTQEKESTNKFFATKVESIGKSIGNTDVLHDSTKKELYAVMATIFKCAVEFMTENVIWFEYSESDKPKSCSVCKIGLRNGDRCRISNCEHQAHAECMARYIDRVEPKCPICGINAKTIVPYAR